MEEVPRKLPGNESQAPKNLTRKHRQEAKKALRLDDLGRRLKEAQDSIDEHKDKYEKERAAEKIADQKNAQHAF